MLSEIINSNKVQENTGNATGKPGYSTLGNWRTRTFPHYCKHFSAPKIMTVKQVVNDMCEQLPV